MRRWHYRLDGQPGKGSKILVDPERHPDAAAVADWLGVHLGRDVLLIEPLDPEPEAPPPAARPAGASRVPLDGLDEAEPGDPEPPPEPRPEPRGEVPWPPGLQPRAPVGSRAGAAPVRPDDGPDPGGGPADVDLDDARDGLDDLAARLDGLAPEPEEPPGAPAPFTADDLLAPAAGSPIMSGRVWGRPGHMVPATSAFPARPRAVS